jgi:hypothetical protein
MLASITPLGERGRGQRWGVTIGAFALGATAAGAVLGAGLGAIGDLAGLGGAGGATRLGVLAALLALAAVLDLTRRVPGPRRQVDERWLDGFRGWVYGLGFGAQLGAGFATVVTSAATFAAFAAAALSGSAAAGGAIGGVFGLIRGVTPALTARVQSPPQLFALHRALERWRETARRGSVGGLALLAIAAATGAVVSP